VFPQCGDPFRELLVRTEVELAGLQCFAANEALRWLELAYGGTCAPYLIVNGFTMVLRKFGHRRGTGNRANEPR
jgi:hypothetical protein